MTAKTKTKIWSSKFPAEDGWYWIKYTGKRGTVICPCEVTHLGIGIHVHTARNDSFTDQTRKCFGFAGAKFGPAIPLPGEE